MTKILILVVILLVIPNIYYYIKDKRYTDLDVKNKYFVRNVIKDYGDYKEFYLSGGSGFDIFVREFLCEKPKAIIQIAHGMAEHSENYIEFMKYLNSKGYIVIANDHRGHGKSISETYPSGYMKNSTEIIDDMAIVSDYITNKHKGLKLILIGHSMGSMLARDYLAANDDKIQKLILTGTPPPDSLSSLVYFLANVACFYIGEMKVSGIINLLVGNKDSSLEFISYDEKNKSRKYKDKLRIFNFTIRYTSVMIDINRKLSKKSLYKLANKDLEIYNLVGADDIVTKADKGIKKSIDKLNYLGYNNISSKVYQNMKHEILCESDRDLVFEDILDILEDRFEK